MKQLQTIIRTNERAATALGHPYITQLSNVYVDLLSVYKAYSEMINTQVAANPQNLFTSNVRAMRAVKKETLRLLDTFIEKSEDIPTAFADCLGGLVSVVAQNATLVLEGSDAATVAKVHGSYKTEADAATKRTTVSLGDLYSEDEKDVLIALELPALPTAAAAAPAVRATLRYFNVATAKMEERDKVHGEAVARQQAKVAELFNAADPAQEGALSRADVAKLIYRLAEDVQNTTEGLLSDGNRDRLAGVAYVHATLETISGVHRDGANGIFTEVLRYF